MTNVGQRSVQGSVAQGIRDAWDKFGEPSGRHVEVLMWMVLYVCLKKLALSVNCYYWAHYLPYNHLGPKRLRGHRSTDVSSLMNFLKMLILKPVLVLTNS